MFASRDTTTDQDNRPLRILLLTQYFWPETFLVNEVVADMRALGCEVTVLTGQPNYPDGDIFGGYSAWGIGRQIHPQGYEIFRIPVIARKKSGLRRILNYASFILSAGFFGPVLLRGQRYDVVFVYGLSPVLQALPALLIRRLKKAALVVWVQDLWPETLHFTGAVKADWILNAVAKVTSYIYRHCDLLLAQSNGFVERIRRLAGDDVLIAVHPNPGPAVSDVGPVEQPLALDPGFNIIFAGNFGAAQSMETILDAAAIVDDPVCRFVLVGSGSRTPWLKQEIERRGLTDRVKLAGRFPPSAMPGIFQQASALLVTLARSEGLALTVPSKLSTYLAVGKPILGSLDGEANEMINGSGSGFAVPAEDAPALAAAINKLVAMSAEQRAEMGRAGRNYFETHLSPKRLAIALEGHLRHAVAIRCESAKVGKSNDRTDT